MHSVSKKRKGTRYSRIYRSYVSDGIDGCRQSKRKRNEGTSPNKFWPQVTRAVPGVVKAALPSGRLPAIIPGRGLKRKIGCIEAVTQIGRKEKLEQEYIPGPVIGQGAFGSVRLCRGKNSRELFACKTLPKKGTVHREVEIMQHLSGHPNVVGLKSVFEDSECVHLVMELCSGGRLLDQMTKVGRFSEHSAANFLRDLVLVIKYCHEMGVVHRDIKPENILLTDSGKVKLADYGLAVRIRKGRRLSGFAGSAAYIAPEILSGHYSEKVDIWSAGVLLHSLLVGALPFQGSSRRAVLEAVKSAKLDFSSGIWESVSAPARDLLTRMLTRDVSSRLSADEIPRHPWILFHTESPSRVIDSRHRSDGVQDGCGDLVDALVAAIARVRISEPKRSRLCMPASQIPQGCKISANLCAAF